jgi:hypothetical protein
VKVFVGLQFNHRQPALASERKDIDHSAVGRRKRGHLRIDAFRSQTSVERLDISEHHRLQPALRMHTPERVRLGAIFVTNRRGQLHQIDELGFIALVEYALFRADPERDFLATLELRGSCATRA